MIPDSFFKITSDSKNNSIAGIGKDEKRTRFEIAPEKKKDFGRILSNKEKDNGKDDPDEKIVKDDEPTGEIGEPGQKKEKKGPAPFLDITNQTATLTKDSKVAPRLGKEKPTAAPEQPWSEPYVEKKEESPKIVKATPVPKDQEEFQQDLTKSETPALLFSRMAKEGSSPLKNMPFLKSKLSEFIPRRNEIEVTYQKDNETGFSLIPLKPQDQDIALINLAVIALNPTDLIVNASKLKPVVKIPDFILEVVEKINSEVKSDMSKTVIVLKNVGIFNGVEVTVTSFSTAKSELNIQFANLTQEAKSVLEMNLDALKQALNEKNHTVHIITATTLKEEPIITNLNTREKDQEDAQKQKQQGQQQQQKEEEET